ncbi:hypothetical protein CB0940_06213 [Cercospora beticola]|uniref:Heterokaryon incompatibility domain-containing protein n=1 Tax=Cercospora beticola TaxID=122368 RepID=A0A2G5HX60_CERBT|nr:hypothetical protein CB0940_06213 [Cercospora beticola]PIA97110.1 hypothetical protein CB0940_06213 [Cercospora beticola]WPA98830.1 hypothetical protein RHO25_003443 [Cercospora beticola]CAK1360112.1 unnamed protein product [Cercospora beticola]
MDTHQAYRTLDPLKKEIRLLRIEATSKPAAVQDLDNVITCSLETVALRDANPFYALSYTWGEPETTARIVLQGQVMLIRINLWNFLSALRTRFCAHPSDTIRVWADYVCIKQGDGEEKKSQISIMGDIYKAADAVYAWLGDLDCHGHSDVECGRAASQTQELNHRWCTMAPADGYELQKMAESKYWTRLWIKQEVILAKDIWFLYGNCVAHWKELRLAKISRRDRLRQSRGLSTNADTERPTSELMTSLLNSRALKSRHDGLPELVRRFRDAECYDPRDRIYALLSLVDPSIRHHIAADYTKTFLQVLLDSYPYWSGQPVTWLHPTNPARKTPIFQYQSFVAQMLMILGPNKLHLISGEKELAGDTTVQAIFTTSGLLEVSGVKVVASIRHSTPTPESEAQQSAWQGSAFVLKVVVATPLPDEPYHRRAYMVYANAQLAEGDLVGRIGNQMFFLRHQGNKAGTLGGQEFILQAVGTEALPLKSSNHRNVQSSIALFHHHCRWYRSRPATALFQLVDTSCHEEGQCQTPLAARGGVSILYNASALVTLLVASNMFQIDGPQRDWEEEDDLPDMWASWMIEEDSRVLGSCGTCRVTRRPSIEGQRGDLVEGFKNECNCKRMAQQSRYEL